MVLEPDADGSGLVVVHTGETGFEEPSWFAEPIGDVAQLVATAGSPLHARERLLVALPMLGTGGGGAGAYRAGVMSALIDAAEDAASKTGMDFVLVVKGEQSYSAAQRIRAAKRGRERWAGDLGESHARVAEELAARARAGKLVAFIGAGLSASAGLPTWPELLDELGSAAGLDETQRVELSRLDARDAGVVLEGRFRGKSTTLNEALRGCFAGDARPSLGHALVASLPISEAATTNYDTLFETAWEAATDEPVAVVPRDEATGARRWLLKLHGDVGDPGGRLVLSRDQYLDFEHGSSAVAAVVQAMLLTRHLLIVGYGLTDETFHRVAHEVRQIRGTAETRALTLTSGSAAQSGRLGTAFITRRAGLFHEMWERDLELVQLREPGAELPAAARQQEILLDYVGHLSARPEAYLLGAGWHHLSDHGADKRLRNKLLEIEGILESDELTAPLANAVEEMLLRFGHAGRQPELPFEPDPG